MFGFEDRTRALLAAIWRHGSISAAAHGLGMDTSNARRHLRTAESRLGETLVASRRGGRDGRNTALTPAAKRLLRLDTLRGVARAYDEEAGTTPVHVGRRVLLAAGRHPEGPVEVHIPPESVTLRRAGPRRPSSARNEIPVRVEAVRPEGEGTYRLTLGAGELRLEALVVRGAMRDLRVREGSRLVAVVKAVAVRLQPVAVDGSR